MNTVTGIIQRTAEEPLWLWPVPQLELKPDQAVFFLRKRDSALVKVAVAGADPESVRHEPRCEALVVSRDFGVRLQLPCTFAEGVSGELDAEVRLRLLDQAAEWPRRLPQTAAAGPLGESGGPDQALGRLVAVLFEAEFSALASGHAYADFSRRLNDPELVTAAETRLRRALARWTDEGIVTVLAVHLLAATSQQAAERSRLAQRHESRLLQARQANELAAVERERALAMPDEVRWRLFEPTDLFPAGARPPRLLKESAAPYEALVSGQHLQLVVRPTQLAHAYILALGPYRRSDGLVASSPRCAPRAQDSRRPAAANEKRDEAVASATEYRWLRLFTNDARSDLADRAPRPGGNRLEPGDTLLFPGDAGAAELFQHYLTIDSEPGWETLIVALAPEALPDARLEAALPPPPRAHADFRAYQAELTRSLLSLFGTEARIYLYQFFHS